LRAHLHRDDPGLAPSSNVEPHVAEDADHCGVVGENLGHEATNTLVTAGGSEVLQQQAPEPVSVFFICDEQGHLRRVMTGALGSSDSDDAVAHRRDEGCHRVACPLNQMLDVPVARFTVQGEEPQPDVLVAHSVMQGNQFRLVLEGHGADGRDSSVGQQHIGCPGDDSLGHGHLQGTSCNGFERTAQGRWAPAPSPKGPVRGRPARED
jgi:hypothetical protein